MKTYIRKYFVCGVVAMSLSGCNDSFLERTPVTDLNDKDYWTTLSDLEAYNNGIYNEAANGSYAFMRAFCNSAWNEKLNGPYPMEAMSDNFATVDATQNWAATVAAGLENQPSGNTNYNTWSWTLLRRINVFLANYNKVKVEESSKLPYVGEALFFRAWFYFYMVQNFGDVPLIKTPLETDSEELYGSRTPRKEVMAQVLDDISKACEYLPEKSWGSNRLTKGAALALKSRIGLYEGTWRKYHNLDGEKEFFDACVAASEKLMGMGYEIYNTGHPNNEIVPKDAGFTMNYGDYAQLFITDDLANNKEVIFHRAYVQGLKMHRMCGYVPNIRNGATKDFVDDFLCVDADNQARPVALSADYNNDTPDQEFANRDPRLSMTVLVPGNEVSKAMFETGNLALSTFPRIGNMKNWPSATGYHAIKYYQKYWDAKGFGQEYQDYPLFRYAEVLLNYAEAKAELNECDEAVLDATINKLRDRVDMPHLTVNPPMDPKYADRGISSLLVEIRRERRVELSFEYLRYHDLMRWAWGDKLAERVLGMRLEDADFSDPRYDGDITKGGTEEAGSNAVYVYKAADGKQYIDVYANTNWAAERRKFDPQKDYLRSIPSSAIAANPALGQNPGWPDGK